MLLLVSPTRAIHLRHYTSLELVGPDDDSLYSLALRRGTEEETFPLTRNREDAQRIYRDVLNRDLSGMAFALHEELDKLYRGLEGDSGYPARIEVRDVEPRSC